MYRRSRKPVYRPSNGTDPLSKLGIATFIIVGSLFLLIVLYIIYNVYREKRNRDQKNGEFDPGGYSTN